MKNNSVSTAMKLTVAFPKKDRKSRVVCVTQPFEIRSSRENSLFSPFSLLGSPAFYV